MTIGSGQAQTADADGNSAAVQPVPSHLADPAGSSAPIRDDPGVLPPGADPENRLLVPFVKHMATDQMQFWGSAKELSKVGALKTFVPFAGFTGMLIASDSWISKQVPDKPNQLQRSKNISNYAVYSLIGAAGGSYLWGHMTHNDLLKEAGFLSGEAALNSTLVAYAFKGITQRPRPYQGDGNGTFFQGGTSFPSEHAAVAWSVATVMAHEYPGILTQIAAYGLASTVTLTRVTSKQHFASDAFVGSVLGWYLGRQIYRAHHDPQLGGAPWGELVETKEKGPRDPANMGSPYVPLDSWVYPVFSRLAALGYVKSAYFNMRPWTRLECARMLEEAGEIIRLQGGDAGRAQALYNALADEFSEETRRLDGASNVGLQVESIYTRTTQIVGRPLEDGYHFGQTLINDYGRPYGEGFNLISGVSAYATAGPLSFYVRGEYQQAPGIPSDPESVLQAIANADQTLPVSNARAAVNRFRLLDSYASFTFHSTQFSFGKQSLWLGPGESGALLFSNNAEPVFMFKMSSVSPFQFPLLSHLFGPAQSEFFLGQLQGHAFEFNGQHSQLVGPGNVNPQPFIQGIKLNFKPTLNVEFGAGFTAQFAGPGLPFTWHNYLRSLYSHVSGTNDPAKRLASFDFTYRIPGIRNWLTVYADTMVVDEYSPIGSTRATVNPGIYMAQLPKVPKMSVRAEGLREPLTTEFPPGFVYIGFRRFRSGYTNEGNLMGSWIGRAGQGGQGLLTYSFSPRSNLQLGYRHQEVSKDFIGGGRAIDYSARSDLMLSRNLAFSAFFQYEQWRFPVLSLTHQSDMTASVQFTFYPHWVIRK
jgi:hypothetical protein